MQDPCKHRWTAVKKRTGLLVSTLGFLGLLIPSEAYSMPGPQGSDSVLVSTFGATKHEGRRKRHARGKKKHQNKITAGEATPNGKAKPRGRGRGAKVVCAEAFDRAKETVRGSQFRAAKEWFAKCARPNCGRALRRQCAVLHKEVIAALPTVVPVVTDATGPRSKDVEVKMDGEILTTHLDGTAIIVDPGDHEFTFAKDGEVLATRRFDVEKGQRDQIVAVTFPSRENKSVDLSPTPVAEEPAAAPEPSKVQVTQAADESGPGDDEPAPRHPRRASVEADPRTGAPWSAYALAGVGLLGVGGYGAFTLKGRADNDALVALCKPNCDPTSVKHIRNTYLAADISLVIGVAALATSTYLFLRSDSAEEESPRSRGGHISGLSIAPTPSGALATVGGSF
jgi:hypothetical protein